MVADSLAGQGFPPRYVVGKLWSRSDFRMLSKLFSYPADKWRVALGPDLDVGRV